ncbi:MAG: hypothetical protein EHM78_09470 [Myxococcaceae bacterium]|nr:MAG: hypothetical protein EHM78_09470 [Myxococcaceae bacterium]
MGLFDFIGDAFGAITAPFTAVIDAGTKLLGLPPVIGDALKIAVGAATGDFVTLMQGSTQLLKDLAASAAETEYAPPKDEAYGGTDGWAPTASLRANGAADARSGVNDSEGDAVSGAITDPVLVGPSDGEDPDEKRALETLARNFDALNRDHGFLGAFGDKVITEKELRETAEDPDAPIDLKRAARYVLDHPDLLDRLLRSKDGDDSGVARGDIELAREESGTEGSSSAGAADGPDGADVVASAAGDADPEEHRALETLRRNFDAMNRDHGFLGAFGDRVITEKELRETAEDPDASLELKRAARCILDNPDLMERLSRSKDGDDQGIARSDIDLAEESVEAAGRPVGSGGSTGTRAAAGSDELSALQTILASFDSLNDRNPFFGDKVLSREELERAATNADTSPALKRALRYVLDHPALLDRLSRSKGFGVSGMSRSDLEIGIEDARRGAAAPGPTTTKSSSGTAKPAGSSGSSGTSKSSSSSSKSSTSRSRDPSIKDILNDKSLSIEERIEMILMVLENRVDDQMLSVTQQMDQNDDKKTNKDDRKKVAKLDKVDRDLNFKMERLMKRKEQLSNLLSTMEMKFASMAQTAIANMGR